MELTQKDRDGLLRILAWEEVHPEEMSRETYLGWTWEEVRVWPATLNRLLHEGLVDVRFHSNSSRNLRLTEEGRALAAVLPGKEEQAAATEVSFPGRTTAHSDEAGGPPELPADLFADIIGHQDVKELLRAALSAVRPVHGLLVWPPARGN